VTDSGVRASASTLPGWTLRLLAEAGWITVVYAAAAVLLDRQAPVLGPIEFAALAGLGALVGAFSRSWPNVGAALLLVVALGAGALGWLASDQVRALAVTDPGSALSLHHAGWLGALAALRGAVARIGIGGAGQLEELLRHALPFVALVWAVTVVARPGPLEPAFSISAIWGTVLLISSGLVGLGLSRLAVLQAGLPNRAARRRWRSAVVGAGLAMAPLAAPFVVLSGVPLAALLDPIVGPLRTLALMVAYFLGGLADWLIELLRPVFAPLKPLFDELAERMENRPRSPDTNPAGFDQTLVVMLAAIGGLIVLLIVFLIARQLLANRHRDEFEEDEIAAGEEHAIVVPAGRRRQPATGVSGATRRTRVRGAVTAYVNALGELEQHPQFARLPAETPAQHALRVRQDGMPAAAELARLAAGYQLARYGERTITRREDRRAISRFERLRHKLRELFRPGT
jgi:hypothetical protein